MCQRQSTICRKIVSIRYDLAQKRRYLLIDQFFVSGSRLSNPTTTLVSVCKYGRVKVASLLLQYHRLELNWNDEGITKWLASAPERFTRNEQVELLKLLLDNDALDLASLLSKIRQYDGWYCFVFVILAKKLI